MPLVSFRLGVVSMLALQSSAGYLYALGHGTISMGGGGGGSEAYFWLKKWSHIHLKHTHPSCFHHFAFSSAFLQELDALQMAPQGAFGSGLFRCVLCTIWKVLRAGKSVKTQIIIDHLDSWRSDDRDSTVSAILTCANNSKLDLCCFASTAVQVADAEVNGYCVHSILMPIWHCLG